MPRSAELPATVKVHCIACGRPMLVLVKEIRLAKHKAIGCNWCDHPIPVEYMPTGSKVKHG